MAMLDNTIIMGNGFKTYKSGTLTPSWTFVFKKGGYFVGEYGAIISEMSAKTGRPDFTISLVGSNEIKYLAKNGQQKASEKGLKASARKLLTNNDAATIAAIGENPNRVLLVAKCDDARVTLTAKEIGNVFPIKVSETDTGTWKLAPGALFALGPETWFGLKNLPGNPAFKDASAFLGFQEIYGHGYFWVQVKGDILKPTFDSEVHEISDYSYSLVPGESIMVTPETLIGFRGARVTAVKAYTTQESVKAALVNDRGFILTAGNNGANIIIATTTQRTREKSLEEKVKELEKKVKKL